MSFDLIAPYYHWLEIIFAQKKMQRARLALLSDIPRPVHILLVGEGPGLFLEKCHESFPEAMITYVDASNAMLKKTERKLLKKYFSIKNIELLHENIFHWQPEKEKYDLLVTHFFLDCFTAPELEQIIKKMTLAATPDANWLIADFHMPSPWLLKKSSQLLVKFLLFFFKVTADVSTEKFIDHTLILKKTGFLLYRRKYFCRGLLKSDWWIKST